MSGPVRQFLMLAGVARNNVTHGGRRTMAALVGMSLSLTLVLLQLGFLAAVEFTSVNLLEQLDFDAVLMSPTYDSIYDAGPVPLERIAQASADPNVEKGRPIWMMFAMWRCPPFPYDPETDSAVPAEELGWFGRLASSVGSARDAIEEGRPITALRDTLSGKNERRPDFRRRELLAIGIDPADHPFQAGPVGKAIEAAREKLSTDARVLLNSLSHPDFGWDTRTDFEGWEMEETRVHIAGGFAMPKGFGADGSVITSRSTFLRHTRWPEPKSASLGLLLFRDHDPERVEATIDSIRERMPEDIEVLSRGEMIARERDHWVRRTATGLMFMAGVVLAMVVAGVVVYQVLANDVRNRLPEYATMKAIGYSDDAPVGIVVMQAAMLAVMSYIPAVAAAAGLYWLTAALATIPMVMTLRNLLVTLVLALVVGVGVSFLTVRKLRAANPADLF
ncbi:MAG: FtsX-like permease family protein [Isosphaeraceae bacterium]